MHTGERSAVAPPMLWVMWTSSAFVFLIGFFHREAPDVIARDLMHEFGAIGATLGLLAATYFYAYAGPVSVPSLLMRKTRERNIHAQLRGPAGREPA